MAESTERSHGDSGADSGNLDVATKHVKPDTSQSEEPTRLESDSSSSSAEAEPTRPPTAAEARKKEALKLLLAARQRMTQRQQAGEQARAEKARADAAAGEKARAAFERERDQLYEKFGQLEATELLEQQEAAYHTAYKAAIAKCEEGNWEAGEALWSLLLEQDASDADVHCCRGASRVQLEKLPEAAADFQRAVELDPERAEAWFSLGSVLADLDREPDAIKCFSTCLAIDNEHVEALLCRGTALLTSGDMVAAADDATMVLEFEGDNAMALGLRGLARNLQGKFIEAVDDLGKALSLDENLEWAREPLKEAEASVQRVRAAAVDAETQRFVRQGADSDSEQEETTLVKASSRPPESKRDVGNRLFREGKLSEAVAAYREAEAAKEPLWPLALSNRALCHFKLQEHAEAIKAADECMEHGEAWFKARLTKFKAQHALKNHIDALATLRDLLWHPGLSKEQIKGVEHEEKMRRQQLGLKLGRARVPPNAPVPAGAVMKPLIASKLWPGDITSLHLLAESADVDATSFGSVMAPGGHIKVVARHIGAEPLGESFIEDAGLEVFVNRSQGRYREAVQEDEELQLAVLCDPDLSLDLRSWADHIVCLATRGVLTLLFGRKDGPGIYQDEDILLSLGCRVVLATTIVHPDGSARRGAPASGDFYVVAFKGGYFPDSLNVDRLAKSLCLRRGLAISVG